MESSTDAPTADPIAAVELATDLRRRAEAAAEKAVEEQTIAIRAAIGAGVNTLELAGLTGLSRARIYQIRDGRR